MNLQHHPVGGGLDALPYFYGVPNRGVSVTEWLFRADQHHAATCPAGAPADQAATNMAQHVGWCIITFKDAALTWWNYVVMCARDATVDQVQMLADWDYFKQQFRLAFDPYNVEQDTVLGQADIRKGKDEPITFYAIRCNEEMLKIALVAGRALTGRVLAAGHPYSVNDWATIAARLSAAQRALPGGPQVLAFLQQLAALGPNDGVVAVEFNRDAANRLAACFYACVAHGIEAAVVSANYQRSIEHIASQAAPDVRKKISLERFNVNEDIRVMVTRLKDFLREQAAYQRVGSNGSGSLLPAAGRINEIDEEDDSFDAGVAAIGRGRGKPRGGGRPGRPRQPGASAPEPMDTNGHSGPGQQQPQKASCAFCTYNHSAQDCRKLAALVKIAGPGFSFTAVGQPVTRAPATRKDEKKQAFLNKKKQQQRRGVNEVAGQQSQPQPADQTPAPPPQHHPQQQQQLIAAVPQPQFYAQATPHPLQQQFLQAPPAAYLQQQQPPFQESAWGMGPAAGN